MVLHKKYSSFNGKTNNCPWNRRETKKKDVGMIDLQVTHDADVNTTIRKANVRLLHANFKYSSNRHRRLQVASK